jgi:hypothetical protein
MAILLSVGRVLLANHQALSTLVWAEDGLFPLCVRAHGLLPCTVDPYAGYLLVVPRLAAWPVSLLALDSWPFATNAVAALLAASAAVIVVVVLRAAGSGVVTSGLVALLPVLAPIMGFEAINVSGSVYMLLLFAATVALCFPPPERFPTWAYAGGLALAGLTVPSSAVLLIPLAVQSLRRRIPRRGAIVTGLALVLALAVQAFVAATAEVPRGVEISGATLRAWVDALPTAVLTVVPGQVELAADGTFTPTGGMSWGLAGLGLVALLVVGGAWLVLLRGATENGVGLLVLVGVAVGAIPAVVGYANNRYFVIPVLLWLAACLVALDRWVPWRREVVMAMVACALVVLWIPGLRASDFRATAGPEWTVMLEQARAACAAASSSTVALTFTPSWPFPGAPFPGATTNVVDCAVIAR